MSDYPVITRRQIVTRQHSSGKRRPYDIKITEHARDQYTLTLNGVVVAWLQRDGIETLRNALSSALAVEGDEIGRAVMEAEAAEPEPDPPPPRRRR